MTFEERRAARANIKVAKFRLGEEPPDDSDDVYAQLSPEARIGMMWQLALNAFAFTGHDQPESGLSRHLVVIQRRRR